MLKLIVVILIFTLLAIVIPIITLRRILFMEKHDFQCRYCSHIFSSHENQFYRYRSFGSLYVKCPKCGQYSDARYVNKD